MVRVTHLCGSHVNGGAARAGYRIHSSLLRAGLHSSFRCLDSTSSDESVICGYVENSESLFSLIRRRLFLKAYTAYHSSSDLQFGYTSFSWPDTGLPREKCIRRANLVHLHWIGKQLISIEEIGRLSQPVVWTLHDQWPFCGAEHHVKESDHRYQQGYRPDNRPPNGAGVDLNLRTWKRKKRHWRRPFHLVAPSEWMAECARSSALMGTWPLYVIPHPLDLHDWSPFPQPEARRLLGLPSDAKILLMVAHDALANPVKGGDLLLQALPHVKSPHPIHVVVVGQTQPANPPVSPYPIAFIGPLHDIISLRLAYSAADLLVVPSRQESFCQVATEAHACGRPVVAFATGGLLDVVDSCHTGSLAQPFDPVSLANSINWVISDRSRWLAMCHDARARAQKLWSPDRVASSYLNVYQSALGE